METYGTTHVLQSQIERLYAVFINYVEAFDRALRYLLIVLFYHAGVDTILSGGIGSLLTEDTLLVEVNDDTLRVKQNVNAPDDSLSCISLIRLIASNFVVGMYVHGCTLCLHIVTSESSSALLHWLSRSGG